MIYIFMTMAFISILVWLGILIYYPIKYKSKVWSTTYALKLSIGALVINILNIFIQLSC